MSKTAQVATAEAHLDAQAPVEIIKGSGQYLAPNSLTLLATLVAREQIPVEAIEKLVQLHREEEDRQAKRAFGAALSAFQAECPVIPKTSEATRSVTKSGAAWGGYKYAGLDEIAKTIRPYLHRNGLSYRWDYNLEGGTCVCYLMHSAGHVEHASFPTLVESAAAMSASQKASSALKYAQRRSLEQVLGLSTGEPDDDAMEGSEEFVTEGQVANIEALIVEAGADRGKFSAYLQTHYGTRDVEKLPAKAYGAVVAALEKRRASR